MGLLAAGGAAAVESVCYGTSSNGRLENGVQLPSGGNNFVSYGSLPDMAGRTYVHSKVRDIVIEAYHSLEKTQPGKVFKYAETGFEKGGKFKPHKTHRNGLSVDFMVPVIDKAGKSVPLPTNPVNRYGYDIEFDTRGRYEEYIIDYEALAAHLVALHQTARQHGAGIWRVIFDPQLAPNLYTTTSGAYLRKHLPIQKTKSWVRHDEHYHVDFQLACLPL
jgi:penicillin-insensitive murein endopeptidase